MAEENNTKKLLKYFSEKGVKYRYDAVGETFTITEHKGYISAYMLRKMGYRIIVVHSNNHVSIEEIK